MTLTPTPTTWSGYSMTHVQLIVTLQKCKCGHARAGSVSSEPMVYAENHKGEVRSIPWRELVTRYAIILDMPEKLVGAYMPALRREVKYVTVDVEQCPRCFIGETPAGEHAFGPTLPNRIPEKFAGIEFENNVDHRKKSTKAAAKYHEKHRAPLVKSLKELLAAI